MLHIFAKTAIKRGCFGFRTNEIADLDELKTAKNGWQKLPSLIREREEAG